MSSAASERLETLFDSLWEAYAAITPAAARIHALLHARGESFRNDHVAFRTFDLAPLGLERLAAPFLALGYTPTGRYDFEVKKLHARSYSHPSGRFPRVFISELRTGEFPPVVREIAETLLEQVDPRALASDEAALTWAPTWPAPTLENYERLLEHSEYAAWLAAFGIRANHFTVHANDLRSVAELAELVELLRAAGERLNAEPSPIQGSAAERLEQCSTLADRVEWSFADGERASIPSCYYEFAWRHADAEGKLFDGFVTQSADKIFESTDVGAQTRRS